MDTPVAAAPAPSSTPAPDAAAPITVPATVAAADKGDFTAFQDAARADRRGTPAPAVEVAATPAAETPAAPVAETPAAPASPPLSKRQQDANERTRLAVERATADLQRELAELRGKVAPQPQTPPEPSEPAWKRYAALPDAPKVEDFERIEDHTAAMSYFVATKVQQETAQHAQHQQFTEQRQRFLQERGEQIQTKLQASADADPEFLDKIPPAVATARPLSGCVRDPHGRMVDPSTGRSPTFANVAAEAAFRSDHPDTLLTYLHAHQDETVAIAALPPSEWLPRLIHLDGRLSGAPSSPAAPAAPAQAPSAPSPSPISAAPPPAPEIRKTGSNADPKQAALERNDFGAMQQILRAERVAKRSA